MKRIARGWTVAEVKQLRSLAKARLSATAIVTTLHARFGGSEGTDTSGALPLHPAALPLERAARGRFVPNPSCRCKGASHMDPETP